MMTYQQTLDYLFSVLPMYQRVGEVAIKKDLNNIRALCEMLGEPQLHFPTIHVAGTNGKGSTSHMLSAVFQAAGKKVGLYTSPHYVDFRERIKVNGEEINEEAVVRFAENYKQHFERIKPSFFEITVAMAFEHFKEERVDIAIIETGLGGRLDSTNIIAPLLSVITNIGYDHMQMLGNTLQAIAFEKAGIIKQDTPVIIGEWHKETALVFREAAEQKSSSIYFASEHLTLELKNSTGTHQVFRVRTKSKPWFEDLKLGLVASYQKLNLTTVLETLFRWNKFYDSDPISDQSIKIGLENVISLTNMKGRWMVMNREPLVITDAAHNAEGMQGILPQLLQQPAEKRHFVLGFVSDKDISKMLEMFPKNGIYYWCRADIPRSKPVADLQAEGMAHGLEGEKFEKVKEAYFAALAAAGKSDLIFVGGSSYVVGDLLKDIPEHN